MVAKRFIETKNNLGKFISERNTSYGKIITHYQNGYTISDEKTKDIEIIHLNKNVKDNSDIEMSKTLGKLR
jgi:hypothetical protein